MSLTANMWTSVSGLLAHGEKMNVIGNNIANVNTVGFKGARMDFQDFVNQYIGTASGMGQVGRGVSVGIVMNDFSQGAFETTNETTDIGITGNGFFQVVPKNSNTKYYTRAGNFRFDAEGALTDPHGYVLQGWKIDNSQTSHASSTGSTATTGTSIKGTGVPVDIKLETFNCPPKHTNSVKLSVNLDSATGNDKTSHEDFPFFSMLNTWDATPNALGEITPLGTESYAYQTTIEVFDEGGGSHKLTVYYDRVEQNLDTNINGMKENEIVWEYLVTMDPAEDVRNFSNPPVPAGEVPEKLKGLLMSGTMTYSKDGQLKDMTAYVPTSNNMDDMNTWVQAPISNSGYPVFAPNFSGRDGASTAWDDTGLQINKNADGFLIDFNMGLRSKTPTWNGNAPSTIGGWMTTSTTDYKQVKVDSGTSPGTIVPVENETGVSVNGVVGADGKVYYQLSGGYTPGQVPQGYTTTTPGVTGPLYEQKKASDGVGEHEALHTDGFIYAQQRGNAGGTETGYLWEDTGGNWYVQSDADGLFYLGGTGTGQTQAALAKGGVTLTAIPEANGVGAVTVDNPIASTRAVAATATNIASAVSPTRNDPSNPQAYPAAAPNDGAVYKYDALGAPIFATTTYNFNGMGNSSELQENASTSYTNNTGKNFFERSRAQDGYTYGELRYVTVSQDGVLSGAYSNGVTLELYQIVLYDFPSEQNLRREGGNLFTETRESGMATSGAAGTGGFGTTESNSLEQSNVDLAREFVHMITTQRGFQANSKSITTTDTMLEVVINMKR